MIVDRYLARETFKPFCVGSLFLIGIFIAYSLTRFLTEANDGLLTPSVVFTLTALKAAIALEVILPISLYIGLIAALRRLYSEWEVTALRAGGFREGRIMAPALAMASSVALLVAAISLLVRPWAYAELYDLEANAEAEAELQSLAPGRFHVVHGKGGRTVFLDGREADQWRGVFLRARRGDALEVISADAGDLRQFVRPDTHELNLRQALVFKQAGKSQLVGRFDAFAIDLPAPRPAAEAHRAKATPTWQLANSDRNSDRAELQWRLSTALSTLLLAGLAVPLSRTRPRKGAYGRLLLAVLIYSLYYNFIGIARTEVEKGDLYSLWPAPAGLAICLALAWLLGRRNAP